MLQFKSLIELLSKLNNEEKCIKYLESLRWNNNITCPYCSNNKCYKFSNKKIYKCSKCRKQFTVKVGTIFENSKVPLQKWFVAIFLSTSNKKGISSIQLSRDIAVTQKTAWFMLHRIRETFIEEAPELLSNIVEVDETYIGGKYKNNIIISVKKDNKEEEALKRYLYLLC